MKRKTIKNRRHVKITVDNEKYLAVRSIITPLDKSFTAWLDEQLEREVKRSNG